MTQKSDKGARQAIQQASDLLRDMGYTDEKLANLPSDEDDDSLHAVIRSAQITKEMKFPELPTENGKSLVKGDD